MNQRDLLMSLAKLLDKYKIPYLLTGSLASSFYGYPRATHDIDFIIEIQKEGFKKILKAIKSLGKSYLADKDQIKEAISKSSQFNIYHLDTGTKIDFWIVENDDFEKNKFKRGKTILIDKQKINLVSAEDLILTKLLWCKEIKSERHLHDCEGILKIQKGKLDKEYLDLWAKKLNVYNLLEEASTSE